MGTQPEVEGTACEGSKLEAPPVTAVLMVLTQVPLGGGRRAGWAGVRRAQLRSSFGWRLGERAALLEPQQSPGQGL